MEPECVDTQRLYFAFIRVRSRLSWLGAHHAPLLSAVNLRSSMIEDLCSRLFACIRGFVCNLLFAHGCD
jgi:hypothetical protein